MSRNIGYLLSHYPSANHTYLLREVRALRSAGIPVTVVTVDRDIRPRDVLTGEEVEERDATFAIKEAGIPGFLRAHAETVLTSPIRYVAGLLTALQLAGLDLERLAYHVFYFAEAVVAGRYLSQAGCSHVHTHYASTLAVIAARVFRFDLSATIHGSAEFIDPRAQRLREKIESCAFVRAISMYGRSQLMLASPPSEWHKFAVVRLGVDLDDFSSNQPLRDPRPFRILTIGQLQPAKGFHVLLDSVALLRREGHDVALTIVGDGPDRNSLEVHALHLGVKHRVTFTGALSQTFIRTMLAESDVFALPSFAEGIPVVLMEAMASRVPCVASRITGIPEIIEDGVSGFLVTPSDEVELANRLAVLATDHALRARIGSAGHDRIVREYDLQSNVARLIELFDSRLTD